MEVRLGGDVGDVRKDRRTVDGLEFAQKGGEGQGFFSEKYNC
jgi:hypothetical protein